MILHNNVQAITTEKHLFQIIGLGAGLTAVCPPAGIGLVALGTGTALIGFGQAAEATVHEDPIRNFANYLGISNKTYDTASEAVPFLTSLGCMGATSVLQFSALRSGASSAVDTVANMTEHATEAEKRVISYETDAYSVYNEGSYNKAPKPNYGPLARDVAGDNRGALLNNSKSKTIGSYRELVNAKQKDAHHIIQDAAMRDIEGYNRFNAPARQLDGPSTTKGTPHNIATSIQRETGGGTYGAERRIGYKALRRSGLSVDEAKFEIMRADKYFMDELGLTLDSPTRIPGNRRRR